ncbi:2'-deoxycytidine 5'-triphosphate deaminase [archaeon]|nr:2'-deoxycytidine 5'-triphosphate deaminase [archaeon]
MVNGILPFQGLKELVDSKFISSEVRIRDDQIGAASFEPSLSDIVYVMPSSILPFPGKNLSKRLEEERQYIINLKKGRIGFLHKGAVHVIPLRERLKLDSGFMGESTGRSSVGRTNTVLRLLTEDNQRYDTIPSGYKGHLYLEVYPGSFPIEVSEGLSLNQIKFAFKSFNNLDEADLRILHAQNPILYDENGSSLTLDNRIEKDSVVMNLRLKGKKPLVLRARKHVEESLNCSRDFSNEDNRYIRNEFWEEVSIKSGRIILSPGEFYLMITRERIAVPPGYVTLMAPYDLNLADLKTQEANLFNPGHGWITKGFAPVLEIKPFGQPIELRDDYPICRISFQKLREEPSCKLYDAGSQFYVKQINVDPGKMFK